MIRELMYKWFGLEQFPCNTCEVLRNQLEESNRERMMLLQRLITPSEPIGTKSVEQMEYKPLSTYKPWRVRQQMLEAEDRHKASIMRNKKEEINKLETELGVKNENDATKSDAAS